MIIRQYTPEDHDAVTALWQACFSYPAPHNNPADSIRRKMAREDGLFFVAQVPERVAGTVMAGWDGHRGWIYSLAVDPEFRGRGIGSALVEHAVAVLEGLDCPKVNLQVMPGNGGVIGFYEKLGFNTEERVSMGRIITLPKPTGEFRAGGPTSAVS